MPLSPSEERNVPLAEKLRLLKGLIMPAILTVAVLGSIYGGVATPTEAAGIGCLGSVIAAIINRKFTFANLKDACFETLKISSMLYWLFFGAQMIIGVYVLAGGDEFVKSSLTALPLGRPPRSRISIFSSVPSPAPPPQQNVCSRIVFSGISKKLLQTFLMT